MPTETTERTLYDDWLARVFVPGKPTPDHVWMTTTEYLELRATAPAREYPVERKSGGPRLFGRRILLSDQFDTEHFTLADEERRYQSTRRGSVVPLYNTSGRKLGDMIH